MLVEMSGQFILGMRSFISLAQPNNGMHPTADTTILKFLQRCGAAGDAGRSAAGGGTRRSQVWGSSLGGEKQSRVACRAW